MLNFLGEDGYTRLADDIMKTTTVLVEGINAIPELKVLGEPDMSVFSFTSDVTDIYAVTEALEKAGWHPDRQKLPPSLHLMVTPVHGRIIEPFLAALRDAVAECAGGEPAAGSRAAFYGMLGTVEDRSVVRNVIIDFIDKLTQVESEVA